jgi:uncharacterized protein (TIGR02284 family)
MADDTISILNNLIRTCRDGQEGLSLAADHISGLQLRSDFEELAAERGELAAELEKEVERLGGTPATSGSVSGSLHRGWLDLRSAVTKGDDHIVAEAERGEDVAKSTFQSALSDEGAAFDSHTRAVIQRVADRVVAAHDRVRQLEKTTSRA